MKYLKLSIFTLFLSANLLAQENIEVQVISPADGNLVNNHLKLRITNNNTNPIQFPLGKRYDDGSVEGGGSAYYFAKVGIYYVTGSHQNTNVISDTLYFGRDLGGKSDFKLIKSGEFYEIPVQFNSDDLAGYFKNSLFNGLYNDYNSTFSVQFVVHLKYMYFGSDGITTIERDFTSQNPSGWLYNVECWYSDR